MGKLFSKKLVFILFFVLCAFQVLAKPSKDPALVLTDRTDRVIVGAQYIRVLEDTIGLSFSQVSAPSFNFPTQHLKNIRDIRFTYWVKVRLINTGSAYKRYYLELVDSHIGEIIAYTA